MAPARVLYTEGLDQSASVAVCIPSYNYQAYIVETLDSVAAQDLGDLELVVVDDRSTDGSVKAIEAWMRSKAGRFKKVSLLQTETNAFVSNARNVGVTHVRTPYVFMLDADNTLYSRCISRCLEALGDCDASVAYTLIERDGSASEPMMGHEVWRQGRMAYGNMVDTMALLRRDHLLAVGGYEDLLKTGGEDYELYCRFIERGYYGIQVPEILCRYRVHQASLSQNIMAKGGNAQSLVAELKRRHPWLKLEVIEVPFR